MKTVYAFTKRSVMVMLAMLLAATAGLIVSPAQQTQAAGAANYKVVGYFPAWGAYGRTYNVSDIDGSKLTHINYAFADICWNGTHGNPDPTGPNPVTWSCQDEVGNISVPNGTIVLGDPWIDAQKAFPGDTWDQPLKGNINQLNKLKQQYTHLKTIISIGGWSWSNRFSDVAATAATRSTFAKSAVSFLRHYGFDGVDLDWEYPVGGGLAGNSVRPDDKHNYTLLLQEIRKELNLAGAADGKSYSLTIASGASPSFASNTELGEIAKSVDWINIMTYDFNGAFNPKSAHNAPLYADPAAVAANIPDASTFNIASAVQGHLNAGVPASKVVLGLPFYGRGWKGCAAGPNGDGQYQNCNGAPAGTWEAGSFDYGDLAAKYVNKNGFVRYWNDASKVPYLYQASTGTYISYDDEQSFGYKINYIKSLGLGGGMFWELSSDCRVSPNYSCSGTKLLDVLANGLNGGGITPPVDQTAPSVPGTPTATNVGSTSVTLAWGASTDNVGVTSYDVYKGSTLAVTVGGASATVTGLTADTNYTFTVKAKDAAGNVSAASAPVTVKTAVSGGGDGGTTCSVPAWTAAGVYTGGQRAVYNGIIYEAKWWTQGDRPDLSGDYGVWKNIGTCSTGGGGGGTTTDTTAPIAPSGLAVTAVTQTSIALSWNASTDNSGSVAGYDVYNGTSLVASVTGLNATVTGLAAGTTYSFSVKAKDSAGNISAASTTVSGKTSDAGTTNPTNAWVANHAYKVGDIVTYNGKSYQCLQAHTSLVGWEPATTASLWKLL
ncbi:glycosyl hydrolase family 18 protein [Paenibacillus sp. MMS18-CY102]|uniref:glycosyl hydrolase family 18 protein n=1 Tax=Paenibacillus sp. MMS18-CY102 TaxID=2682849 RepID=UPI001365F384|nr:glycosyl hydrolase family 18 protein [Paenibacillus sp. MMS18-CY102]MWC31306.1 chitinase [Paenibacillus sp. MMS18-CY102]